MENNGIGELTYDFGVDMSLSQSVLTNIGNTPLIELQKIKSSSGSRMYVKPEYLNPSGSVKDRMAHYIINEAEKTGLLSEGGTIVENSSGNTGTALAMIAAIKGYQCIITMPDKMSDEKKNLMRAFGAKVVVTPTAVPADSPESYYSVARRIAQETPNSYYPDQYNNPMNIDAHYYTTGPEIWEQTNGQVDVFVAGIGTGGTLSGVGRYLKEKNPAIRVVAVDPIGSVFYDYFKTGKLPEPNVYQVEGIGEDYLVKAVDFSVIDEIIQVNDKDSFLMTRRIAEEEGLFAGGSSGSAVWTALKVADALPDSKDIVTILPDSGNRYLSKIYNDDWMKENGFIS